jgi:uncharacterized membrane protein SpoIIM required for sporulation
MVLEVIQNPEKIRKRPVTALLVAFLLCSVSIFAAYNFSPQSSGILSVAFVTIAIMPLVHALFIKEEEEEVGKPGSAPSFLLRHFHLMKFYAWFFIGLVISYSFWFAVMPDELQPGCETGFNTLECRMPVKKLFFREQLAQFSAITGSHSASSGGVAWDECKNHETRNFEKCTLFIFNNNSLILGLSVLFSFIYGAGALMLIGWQASVVGVFIGKEITETSLLSGIALGIGYLPHGILEIPAYFIGAIAGGIISVAISRRKYGKHEFEIIAKDVLALMLIAYLLLLIGAAVESWLILQQPYV